MDVLGRIKQLLRERDISLYRLAENAGMEPQSLNTMFRRHSTPSVPTLEKICSGFGISLAQFFSMDGEPTVLTEEQREVLELWSARSPEQKEHLLQIMKQMK